mmetsp:Transcript_19576/g.53769  ORF Transcript_19576/g.53769 Transcript_19576/m.53769 type:complete len:106 (-) Transcript_19576:264-581(-)
MLFVRACLALHAQSTFQWSDSLWHIALRAVLPMLPRPLSFSESFVSALLRRQCAAPSAHVLEHTVVGISQHHVAIFKCIVHRKMWTLCSDFDCVWCVFGERGQKD